jgi:branched-chain amino acid transport system permease protein
MGSIVSAGLVGGSIYALLSLGFAIAFRLSSVFNLAYGVVLVGAAYLNYAFLTYLSWPPWISIPLAIVISASLEFGLDGWLIPYAKKIGASSVEIMVASWLILVIIQDLLILIFSNSSIYVGNPHVKQGWAMLGTYVTPMEFSIVVISATTAILLYVGGRFSGIGREIAAVSDNASLSRLSGVNVGRVRLLNAGVASLIATTAGVLLSYQERFEPTLGMRFSIIAVVSTLVGNRLGASGAVVGALALGFLESFVIYVFDPRLRDSVIYLALFVVVSFTYSRRLLPLAS